MISTVNKLNYTQNIVNQGTTETKKVNVGPAEKNKNFDSLSIASHLKQNGDRFSAYEILSGDYKISSNVEDLFDEYYSGNKSLSDITNEFDDIVKKIQKFDAEQGVASENDMEHYGKILSDVSRRFRQCSVSSSFTANQNEGEKIANQYGTADRRGFLYYNSDYYYKAEDINNLILGHAKSMAANEGTVLSEGNASTKDVYKNFNTYWANFSKQELHMGELLDTNMKPPKDFNFFYKEQKYGIEEMDNMLAKKEVDRARIYDGIFKVSCGNWSTGSDVNLSYELSEIKGKNLLDLVNNTSNRIEDVSLSSFLKNININRSFYGY